MQPATQSTIGLAGKRAASSEVIHGKEPNAWIGFCRRSPLARVRLFCFPYAGAGASIFRPWASLLPPDIEIYAVQLPGREERIREESFTSIGPLTEALAHELAPWLKVRYAFFGHSLGAIVAYELIRLLRHKRLPLPFHLFVSGRRAPQLPPPRSFWHQLSDPEFINKLRQLNGIPKEVLRNPEFLAFIVPLLKADFAIGETYSYVEGPPLMVPVSVFGGTMDTSVPKRDLADWVKVSGSRFRLKLFHGDHFFLHSRRRELLEAIISDLRLGW